MISIIKIPFDKCIVEKERRGAALGPDAIETELKNFFEFEEKVSKKTKFLEIKEKNDFNKLHKEVEKIASNEYKKGNLVVGLGGDHSVSYGLMKAFAKKFQKPKPSEARLGPAKRFVSLGNSGLIYFDAHLDCQDDFLPPTHEDVLRAVVNEKLFGNPSRTKFGWAQRNQRFRSGNIFHIGARNFTEKERKFIAGKMWFNFAEMFYTEIAPAGTLDYLKDFVKTVDNIYISIDIDAIEPAFAPGTGWPEPAGILPWQMIRMLQFLKATKKVRGFDIVEVSPPKDVNKITSRLAARLLLELLK